MDAIYFWVSSLDCFKDRFDFHAKYFIDGGAFLYGFLLSVGVGIVVAFAFYFVCCNGKNAKPASVPNWLIALVLAVVAAYFLGDVLVMGSAGTPGSGFYAACNKFANDFVIANSGNMTATQECMAEYNTIIQALQKGKDVALEFNLTNAFLAAIAYFATSMVVKNLTKHGTRIPF